MNLGAFVLTFNRPAALRQNLQALLDQTRPPDIIVVVDNAASDETRKILSEFRRADIVYHPTETNLGSAGGTSLGTTLVAQQGCDLIYSGDDDNPPRTADTLERILNLLTKSSDDVAGAGTVGARWDWRRGETQRLRDEDLVGPLEVDFIGGDHKLTLRSSVLEMVSPPDSKLFFGYPDLEHCLRIRNAGFRLLVEGELMQRYRELTGRLNLRRKRHLVPTRSLDSIWRDYYTTRNYIYMMLHEFNRPRPCPPKSPQVDRTVHGVLLSWRPLWEKFHLPPIARAPGRATKPAWD